MTSIEEFLDDFKRYPDFAWTKINHGFWEALGNVHSELGWPVTEANYERADTIAKRSRFFDGGFVDELLALIETAPRPGLVLAMELSGWPDDNRLLGTPADPTTARILFDQYSRYASAEADGLLLKRAIHDGSMGLLFDELRNHSLVVVGPQEVATLAEGIGSENHSFVPIHSSAAREHRLEVEREVQAAIDAFDGEAVVLVQAGTLAPYWIFRLRPTNPNVRWIDGGLAFSIFEPEDILRRPWGKAWRQEIVAFHNSQTGADLPEQMLLPEVALLEQRARADIPPSGLARFVDDKPPDYRRVAELLSISAAHRQWANGGPLVHMLEAAYAEYMHAPDGTATVALANAGIGLEVLARTVDEARGKHHRWGVSAFTFKNQRRGYFANAKAIDCHRRGMMGEQLLRSHLEAERIDGFIVTNIFGIWSDFTAYIEIANEYGVPMLIDNAAGIGPTIPNWPYQAFSLHHTKPYGFGEGGLIVIPEDEAGLATQLITYDSLDSPDTAWLNNAKLSDAAAAYQLDRLERSPQWIPFFQMQGLRISKLAKRAGLDRLFNWDATAVATSMPFLTTGPSAVDNLDPRGFPIGRYYQPLAETQNATAIHSRIVNIPTHPDVAQLDDDTVLARLAAINVGPQ